MPSTMKCLYLKGGPIDNDEVQKLIREESDVLFLVDRNGILRGKMSTKAYSELSKFFELHVMSYPRSPGQLEDVLISGAASVVIPPDLPYGLMEEMSWLTENIILPFSSKAKALEFERLGGSRYLARADIQARHSALYYVGSTSPDGNSIVLAGFPDEMNNPNIF